MIFVIIFSYYSITYHPNNIKLIFIVDDSNNNEKIHDFRVLMEISL
jgi:hypothetical protein